MLCEGTQISPKPSADRGERGGGLDKDSTAMKDDARKEIERAHSMINVLETALGSLEHLYFAFTDAKRSFLQASYSDAAIHLLGALAISFDHASAKEGLYAIRKFVEHERSIHSDYVRMSQVRDTRVLMEKVPSKSIKKLLCKRGLVIEKWDEFVCRVPHFIRENVSNGTSAIIGIPPPGMNWNLPIIKTMQDACRTMGQAKTV